MNNCFRYVFPDSEMNNKYILCVKKTSNFHSFHRNQKYIPRVGLNTTDLQIYKNINIFFIILFMKFILKRQSISSPHFNAQNKWKRDRKSAKILSDTSIDRKLWRFLILRSVSKGLTLYFH